jgi:hypothetical protein
MGTCGMQASSNGAAECQDPLTLLVWHVGSMARVLCACDVQPKEDKVESVVHGCG